MAFLPQLGRLLGDGLRHVSQLLLQRLVGDLVLLHPHLQLLRASQGLLPLVFQPLGASEGLPASGVRGLPLALQLEVQVLGRGLELGGDAAEALHLLPLVLLRVLQAQQLVLGTAMQSCRRTSVEMFVRVRALVCFACACEWGG